MARQSIVTAAVAAALALAATAAGAQSVDQLQNRYQLQQSQQRLDQSAVQRQYEADRQSQNIQNRIERQAIERQLSVPRYRPPVSTFNNGVNRY